MANQRDEELDVLRVMELQFQPLRPRLSEVSARIISEGCLNLTRKPKVEEIIRMQMSELSASHGPGCPTGLPETRSALANTRKRANLSNELGSWAHAA